MIAQILVGSLLILDSVLRAILLLLRIILPLRELRLSDNRQTQRLIVLIPAHNEAGIIGPTILAIREQLTDRLDCQLWVLADRCTDATASEAAEAGALVAERPEGQLGKGAMLAWWLKNYSDVWQPADGIVILDADSRIRSGSLQAWQAVLLVGYNAGQGYVAPQAANRAARLTGWSEVLMQRIDDEARHRCAWSVPLRGTGMVMRASLLAELAPHLHTLAEDLELDLLLAAKNERVALVAGATIIDPKPIQSAGAARQRARWLQGQFQVLRDYAREFGRALMVGGGSSVFLLVLLFLRPKLALIALRLSALFLCVLIGEWDSWFVWLVLSGILLDFTYYLAGAAFVDERNVYLRDLLATPRYLLMWLYGLTLALVKRGWLRAGR